MSMLTRLRCLQGTQLGYFVLGGFQVTVEVNSDSTLAVSLRPEGEPSKFAAVIHVAGNGALAWQWTTDLEVLRAMSRWPGFTDSLREYVADVWGHTAFGDALNPERPVFIGSPPVETPTMLLQTLAPVPRPRTSPEQGRHAAPEVAPAKTRRPSPYPSPTQEPQHVHAHSRA